MIFAFRPYLRTELSGFVRWISHRIGSRRVKYAFLLAVGTACYGGSVPNLVMLTVERTPRQRIEDWVTTVSPMDWDGRPTLRDGQVMGRIVRDFGFTRGRLIIGKGDILSLDRTLNAAVAGSLIGSSVALMASAGLKSFSLSIVTPPQAFKAYLSDSPFVNGDSNRLRAE